MTPLTDTETIACQMAELAFGYYKKFNRYDEFTYYCSSHSLMFYPMNPNAWIIRGKSLDLMIQDYLTRNGNIIDDYAAYLIHLVDETKWRFDKTYMTEETEEIRKKKKKQALKAQQNIQESPLPK